MVNYETGFMKPPQNTKFKPGQSGNPKGRPVGSKNLYTYVDEVANEKIKVVKNGKTVSCPKIMVALEQTANKAAAGNLKAIQTLVTLVDEADRRKAGMAKVKDFIYQDDRAIIEQFLKDNGYEQKTF